MLINLLCVRYLHSDKPRIQLTIQRATDVGATEYVWGNRERSRLAAASSVCDSTKHNGLVTLISLISKPALTSILKLDSSSLVVSMNLHQNSFITITL